MNSAKTQLKTLVLGDGKGIPYSLGDFSCACNYNEDVEYTWSVVIDVADARGLSLYQNVELAIPPYETLIKAEIIGLEPSEKQRFVTVHLNPIDS